MLSSSPSEAEALRLYVSLAVGLGLIVAGGGNALFGPRRWWGQLIVGGVGVAVACGIAFLFSPTATVWIAGLGTAALAALTVARTDSARRLAVAAVRPFRHARVRWAAAAVVGAAGLGYEQWRFDAAEQARFDREMADFALRTDRYGGVPLPNVMVTTDRGTRITAVAPPRRRPAAELRESEARCLSDLPYRERIIHRGPPSDDSNCHGWVFAGGKYGLNGNEVETILAENDYREVASPAAGDVCIYRDTTGAVSHSAVVRAVCDDGTILVEGKWGWMGVYLHPVDASCYGTDWHYYHTPRATHVLTTADAAVHASASNQP